MASLSCSSASGSHAHSPSFSIFTGSSAHSQPSFSSLCTAALGSSSSSPNSWTMDLQPLDGNESAASPFSSDAKSPSKLIHSIPSPLSSSSSTCSPSTPSLHSRGLSLVSSVLSLPFAVFPLNRFRWNLLSSFHALSALSSLLCLSFLFSQSLIYHDDGLLSFSFKPLAFFSQALVWSLTLAAAFFGFSFFFFSANHNSYIHIPAAVNSPVSTSAPASSLQVVLDRFFSLSFCVSTFNFFFCLIFLLPLHLTKIYVTVDKSSCSHHTVCFLVDDFLWLLLFNIAPFFFHLIEMVSAPAHRLAFAVRGRLVEMLFFQLWIVLLGFFIFQSGKDFSLVNFFSFFASSVPAILSAGEHRMSTESLLCQQVFFMIVGLLVYFFCGAIASYSWNLHQLHTFHFNAVHKNSSFHDLFRFAATDKPCSNRENASSASRRRIANQSVHQHSRSSSFSTMSGNSTPPNGESTEFHETHVAEYEIAIFTPNPSLAPLPGVNMPAMNGDGIGTHADSQHSSERSEHNNASNISAFLLDEWLLVDSESSKRPAASNPRNRFTDAPVYPAPAVASSAWM